MVHFRAMVIGYIRTVMEKPMQEIGPTSQCVIVAVWLLEVVEAENQLRKHWYMNRKS